MKLLSPETGVSRPITDRVKESLFNVLWNYGFPKDKILADLFCGVGSLGLEALSRGAEFVTFVEKDPRIITTLKKNIEKAGFRGESKVVRADAFKIGAPPERDPSLGPRDPFSAWGHLTPLGDALRRVERRATSDGRRTYDLIFVDPPYSATRNVTRRSAHVTRSPLGDTLLHLGTPYGGWSDERQATGDVLTPLSKLLLLLSEQSSLDGIVVVRTERRTELLEQYGRLKVIERRQWGTMAVTILREKKIVNE